MEGSAGTEGVREAPVYVGATQAKPMRSAVPETPIHVHVSPISTIEGMIGVLLLGMLIWHAVAFLMKRRVWRSLVVLCLACAVLLAAISGIARGIAITFGVLAENSQTGFHDMAGGVYVAIVSHWWMLAVSVVTIPLGIYWTVRAYMNEVIEQCSFCEEEADDDPENAEGESHKT